MGYNELIEELGREVEEKIEAARRRAEEEFAKLKKENASELERLRQEREGGGSQAAEEARRTILAEARQNVLKLRLTATGDLSERLHRLALALLPELCGDGYDELFENLVGELPEFPWETVRVNPRDRELALRHFPDAKIVVDEAICGGMEVSGTAKMISIINTLEKRLERLWPELLPDLLAAAYREIDRDAFAAD